MKRGTRVAYCASHCAVETGTVKRMADGGTAAFVLYDTKARRYTENDLDHFTCARTSLRDLVVLEQIEEGAP